MNASASDRRAAEGRARRAGWLALATIQGALGCAPETPPAKGQITLAISTDMAVPKDVDGMRVQVLAGGVEKLDREYRLGSGPGRVKLPATLAIVAGEEPRARVEVRLLGFLGNEARTMNRVVTTVPESRNALLRLPMQWLCDGTVSGSDGSYASTCEADEAETACVAGDCRTVELDSGTLPDFSPARVFGGASEPDAAGACFEVEHCFRNGFEVTPDAECNVALDLRASAGVTFALALEPGRDGICSGLRCYVPLDASEEFGVRELEIEAGQRVFALPQAACDRVMADPTLAVFAATDCGSKVPDVPTCGTWSSVGSDRGEPPDECSGFRPGDALGTLTEDALANQYLQAAGDIKSAADESKTRIAESCVRLALAQNGPDVDLGDPPTDGQLERACTTALELYAASDAPSHFALGSTHCLADVAAQQECEAACFASASASIAERCPIASGSCAGDCTGDCHSSSSTPSNCSGVCVGLCVGECSDRCLGTFAAEPSDTCGGTCRGDCAGTCAGACSSVDDGVCAGTCVAHDAGDETCDDWRGEPDCALPLSVDVSSDRICSMLCTSAASTAPICTSNAPRSDGTSGPVLEALQPMHEEHVKVELLISGASALGELSTELETLDIDPFSAACIAAANDAVREATASLEVARAAAASIAGPAAP